MERSTERFEHAIVGTHERLGERVGLIAVTPKFEDDGVTRRGTLVELSTAVINGDYVGVQVANFLDDGNLVGSDERVAGVEQPHMGYLYFNQAGERMDWSGSGYYKMPGYAAGWGVFDRAFPYNRPSVLESGTWAVGDADILGTLRAAIAEAVELPEDAANMYAATYVRFNRLLLDSFRHQLKNHAAEQRHLGEILIIDAELADDMLGELDIAQAYQDFTRKHIESDKNWLDKLRNETTLSVKDEVAQQFDIERQRLAEAHRTVSEQCQAMHDSIYVPSGFRIGPGRSWPYMDIGDYDREVKALQAGNFGMVVYELEREIKELDYKQNEFITPHVSVLATLAGRADPLVYS